MSYASFAELGQGLDGYVDELCPYAIDNSQTIFPKLPLELREEIYSHLLPAHDRSINPHNNVAGNICYDHRYMVFHVNHATRFDMGLWYLRRREFELGTHSSYAAFSRSLEWFPGEQGFRSVRHLEFYKFWAEPDVDLILRCADTRTLKLWFKQSLLTYLPQNRTRFIVGEVVTAEEVAHNYSLGRLFGMRRLERIELKWQRPPKASDYEHDSWCRWYAEWGREEELVRRMEELKAWLMSGFAAAGRAVLVELVPV
jgi:hypothetical protein